MIKAQRKVSGAAGFGLAELLVAAAVFAIAIAIAFTLYSETARSYRDAEQLTIEQQNVRTAFDRMLSEIRVAGFNTNPDGDRFRPDQQVEGAWGTAIAFRTDLDFGKAPEDSVPEISLAEPHFRVVSIGNDEIITYVLAKKGPQGPDSLILNLDADRPRSGLLTTIKVPQVTLSQDDPPYVLYRVTLANLPGRFPQPPQPVTSFVYEPIAEGIRSLKFEYYDRNGDFLNIASGVDSSAIPGESLRSQVRSIKISIVGMIPPRVQDGHSTEVPGGSLAGPMTLSSVVHLENMGKRGIVDSANTPPAAPEKVQLVPGHCRSMLVTWRDPRPQDDIGGFVVRFWPKGSAASRSTRRFPFPSEDNGAVDRHGHAMIDGLSDSVTYCFQVRAFDSRGDMGAWSSESSAPCAQVTESTTPSSPKDLTATGGRPRSALEGEIELRWTPTTTNTRRLEGDPDSLNGETTIRDLKGYKVYRASESNFVANDTTTLIAEVPESVGRFVDRNVANCKDYYYKIRAIDWCAVPSIFSPIAEGRAETGMAPAAPSGLMAFRLSEDETSLSWDPVRVDVNGRPVYIDQYKIHVYGTTADLSTSILRGKTFSPRGTVIDGSTTYTDTLDLSEQSDLMRGGRFYYAVSAADRCGNEGTKSEPIGLSCTIDATLDPSPKDGDSGSGIIPITLRTDATRSYPRARVRIVRRSDSGAVVYDHQSSQTPSLFPAWNTKSAGPGDYRISWGVITADGCSSYKTTDYFVKPRSEGGLSTTSPVATAKDQGKRLAWDLINTVEEDLEIVRLDVTWFSSQEPPALMSIEYPTGRVVSNAPRGGPQEVSERFDISPLPLSKVANGLCQDDSCRLNMSLTWDSPVFSGRSVTAERVTVRYYLRDAAGRTGSAVLIIWPDLRIVMDKPDDFNTPN